MTPSTEHNSINPWLRTCIYCSEKWWERTNLYPPWLIVIKLECWKCLVSGSTIVMMRRTWWICRRSFTPSATTWTTGRNFSTKVQPHLPFKFELTFIQNCFAERTGSWSMKVNLNVSGSPMFKNYGWSVVIGLVIHIMTWKSFMRLSHDFFWTLLISNQVLLI